MRSKSQILSKLRADGHITDEEYKMLAPEPCEDAISRQAAQAELKNCEIVNMRDENDNFIGYYNADTVDSIVLNLPPVTLQLKTGHWIGIDEEPHEDYECDKCGYTVSTHTANIEPHTEYKYCPNCGAKMEGEE